MKAIRHLEVQQKALAILREQFTEVPGVRHLVHKQNREKATEAICRFCLAESMDDGLAFISEDHLGVALLTRHPARFRWKRWWRMLGIVRHSTGLTGALPALRFMHQKDRMRSREAGFYFLMLAATASPSGISPVVDLKNQLFAMADREQLPIFLEASVRKNMLGYQRYGFETYAFSEATEERPFPFWYMRRAPRTPVSDS